MTHNVEANDPEHPSPVVAATKPRLLHILGPGLITAPRMTIRAALPPTPGRCPVRLWPHLDDAVHIPADVGRPDNFGADRTHTGHGIAGVLRRHYPNWLLQFIVILLLVANTINGPMRWPTL